MLECQQFCHEGFGLHVPSIMAYRECICNTHRHYGYKDRAGNLTLKGDVSHSPEVSEVYIFLKTVSIFLKRLPLKECKFH